MGDLLACPFCGCAARPQHVEVICENCSAIAASPTEWNMRAASGRVAVLEDAIRAILPMAKGYMSAHRVGRNEEICREAEQLL